MRRRSVLGVIGLSIITLGIYSIYWTVVSKSEMNGRGARIPTAWLILIPFVNIWWLWKFCEGVEHVTRGAVTAAVAFILFWLLGVLGMGIIQSSFNKVAVS